jgi:hypothetical protein
MKVLIITLVCLAGSCSNKIVVQKYDGSANIEEKFFYALPANTLEIECKIKKESYTRGNLFLTECEEFLRMAVDSFDMDKNIMMRLAKDKILADFSLLKDGFSWSLGAVPDSNKIYTFKNKPSFLKDNSFSFAFNRDWMLSTATVTSENKAFEILTTFLAAVTGTAGAIFKGGSSKDSTLTLTSACAGKFAPLIKARREYQNFLLNPPNVNAEDLQMMKATRLKAIEKLL